MEMAVNKICCGCLSNDRKMVLLKNLRNKHYYLDIIRDFSTSFPEDALLWVCWECQANIMRCQQFKRRVKDSYTALMSEHMKKENNLSNPISQSKLQTHTLFNLNFIPNITESDSIIIETIKTEISNKSIETPIKEETDNIGASDRDSDDDNKALIDLTTKKKQGKRKKEHKLYKEIELTEEQIREERRKAAEGEDYINAMFRCEKCIVTFPNADDLDDHTNVKHDKTLSQHKCKFCECTFRIERSYIYHTNKHKRRYKCIACNVLGTSKHSATKHYHAAHSMGVDIQYEVEPIASIENENGDSESNSLQSREFACELCPKRFRWKTSLRKHAETHRIEMGQKRRPYCEPCRLSFATTSNLQKHVKTSSKHQIMLKVRILNATPEDKTKQEAKIEQVKRAVNGSRAQYRCPQCDKRFQWRGNLSRHLHSHAARANGELVCDPCNRTFSSIATYTQHMKISKKHVSENDFKYMCSECGKKFANKTRLKDHVDWEHLKNYVHTCPDCHKAFKSHTSLYLHRQVVHRRHGADHLCHHCGKPFPNQAKLRSHVVALHSGQSPYACSSCPARFGWHSCLSRHVRRVHSAARTRE